MARKKREEPVGHEVAGTAFDPGAVGHELQGRATAPEPIAPAPEPVKDQTVPDAGALFYRDKSAPPREKILTEGQVNFKTITNAARGILPSSETE